MRSRSSAAEECDVSWTTVVSEVLARAVAETYHLAEGGSGRRRAHATSVLLDGGGIAAFYAFRFEGGGFVVIGADLAIAPVLAFGGLEIIDFANLSPAQDRWAHAMRRAVEALRRRGTHDGAAALAWAPLLDVVATRGELDPSELARARQVIEARRVLPVSGDNQVWTVYANHVGFSAYLAPPRSA